MSSKQRSTRVSFSTSRREWEFLLFNLPYRYETRIFWHLISGFETRSRKILLQSQAWDEIYHLHYQALRREREFFWSDISFRDENESSKLFTLTEVSDLNGLANVHSGRPTIIKCAYDLSRIVFSIYTIACYRTRVRSFGMFVTNWLTHALTHSCLVNLIDMTLAFEDDNSKLVELVTVADVSDEDSVGNSLLQIWKLNFGQKA